MRGDVKLRINSSRHKVEGYKNIPDWVCSNLITYGNCAVSDSTYEKMGGIQALTEWGCKCRVVDKPSGKVIELI